MTDEQANINKAFENYLAPFLSQEAREQIAARYGEAVATKVKAIYDDALNCPVDWRTATIDTALPVLRALLTDKYPWLSRQARSNLINAFIMDWK